LKIFKYLSLLLLSLTLTVLSETNIRSQTAQSCANGPTSRLSFTVIDQKGEFPTGVTKEDVTLKVDGNITPVLGVERQTELPLDLAILIDVSVSQDRAIAVTKPVAKAMLQEILRSSNNRVALISFSNTIEVEKDLTSNASLLVSTLEAIRISYPPGYIGGGVVVTSGPPTGPRSNVPGSTSLWDTATKAVEQIFPGRELRTRAVLLLTDGDDTASHGKLNTLIKTALDRDIVVYSLGVEGFVTLKRDSLKKLSEETGGIAAFPKNRNDLVSAGREIVGRLTSQYVVSFCSAAQKTGPSKYRLELNNQRFPKARVAYVSERK
jgi:Ca-activated chloride channel homolog